MYTLRLSEEQVHATLVALAAEIDASGSSLDFLAAAQAAQSEIYRQWHAQHVAQRDAKLREQDDG